MRHEAASGFWQGNDKDSFYERLSGRKATKQSCANENAKGVLVTVPVQSGKDVSIGVVLKILRDAEISREEFIELAKKV